MAWPWIARRARNTAAPIIGSTDFWPQSFGIRPAAPTERLARATGAHQLVVPVGNRDAVEPQLLPGLGNQLGSNFARLVLVTVDIHVQLPSLKIRPLLIGEL